MPKFPEPPAAAALAARGADWKLIPSGTRVWRIYFQAGAHPTTWGQFRAWGPTDSRFDHHLPPPSVQARQILYGAVGPHAAVSAIAEVFQQARAVNRHRRAPTFVAFDVVRDLKLVDLAGSWPTKAGASMAIGDGARSRARRWSQAIYEAFPDADGLHYSSSMHRNAPAVALYERSTSAMPARPVFHRSLADPLVLTLLRNVCAGVAYKLL